MRGEKTVKKLVAMIVALGLLLALAPAALASEGEGRLFTDVPDNAWYADDLEVCWAYDLVSGTGGGKFSPDKSITLAEAVTFAARVYNVLGWPETEFVQGDPWYQVYVDYAVEKGIIEKEQFADLSVPATRRQFAAIMAGAMSGEGLKTINPVEDGAIPDVEAGSEYYDEIYALYRAGILTGSENGKMKPDTPIKRSEAVAVIARCVDADRLRSFMLTKEGYRVRCAGGIAYDFPEGFTDEESAANMTGATATEDGEVAAAIMVSYAPAGVTPETVGKIKPALKSFLTWALEGEGVTQVELTETRILGYEGMRLKLDIPADSDSAVPGGKCVVDVVLNTDTGYLVTFALITSSTAKKDYNAAYEALLAGAVPDTTGSLKPDIRPEFITATDEIVVYMRDYLDLARRYDAATESQRQLLALELTGLMQRYADIQERYAEMTEDMSDGEMTYMVLMILSLRDLFPDGGEDIDDLLPF